MILKATLSFCHVTHIWLQQKYSQIYEFSSTSICRYPGWTKIQRYEKEEAVLLSLEKNRTQMEDSRIIAEAHSER